MACSSSLGMNSVASIYASGILPEVVFVSSSPETENSTPLICVPYLMKITLWQQPSSDAASPRFSHSLFARSQHFIRPSAKAAPPMFPAQQQRPLLPPSFASRAPFGSPSPAAATPAPPHRQQHSTLALSNSVLGRKRSCSHSSELHFRLAAKLVASCRSRSILPTPPPLAPISHHFNQLCSKCAVCRALRGNALRYSLHSVHFELCHLRCSL